jgi:hypothetical protein
MAIEKHDRRPERQGLPLPAVIVIGALAIFGAITAVQWALGAVVGVVKFGLVILIVFSVGAWIVSAKGRR